jgi:hypothetical protein
MPAAQFENQPPNDTGVQLRPPTDRRNVSAACFANEIAGQRGGPLPSVSEDQVGGGGGLDGAGVTL